MKKKAIKGTQFVSGMLVTLVIVLFLFGNVSVSFAGISTIRKVDDARLFKYVNEMTDEVSYSLVIVSRNEDGEINAALSYYASTNQMCLYVTGMQHIDFINYRTLHLNLRVDKNKVMWVRFYKTTRDNKTGHLSDVNRDEILTQMRKGNRVLIMVPLWPSGIGTYEFNLKGYHKLYPELMKIQK